MPSVCVYYVWDGSEPEWEHLKLSLKTMLAYEWVRRVFVLSPLGSSISYDDSRVMSVTSEKYGCIQGDKISLDEGGWDEVATRNDGIEMCEQSGCDWVLQCDCDEFWTPQTEQLILEAEKNDWKMIAVENKSFVDPWHWKIEPACRTITPNGLVMYDIHVRLWRTNFKLRYDYPHKDHPYINKTMHCGIPLPGHPEFIEGVYNCHVHDMIGYKKRVNSEFEVMRAPESTMPIHYIEAWEAENVKT